VSIRVVVDTGAAVPVYEQIRSQLAGAIGDGRLSDGQRLPAVRVLAADLGIAVNTVSRAYTELESAGLIVSRRRTGSVVTSEKRDPVPAEVLEAAAELARLATTAHLTAEQSVDLLRSAFHANIITAR